MLNFYEKRKFRRFFYSYLTLGVLSFLVLMLGFSVWGRFETERITREKREELSFEHQALEERAAVLSAEIHKFGSGRGVEEEVREKFEVGSPGEKLIVVVDPPEEETAPLPIRKQSLWQKFQEWFTGE